MRRSLRRTSAAAALALFGLVEASLCWSGILVPGEWQAGHRLFHRFYRPDDLLFYRPRPNLRDFVLDWPREGVSASYSTDEIGFRNRSRSYETSRVFFVGDSFVWGAWVSREESLVGVLESELGEPVINLGVGSYDFQRYQVLFQEFVARYRPRVCALGVFPNDLRIRSPLVPGQPGTGARYFEATGWNRYSSYPAYRQTLTYWGFRRLADLFGMETLSDQYNLRLRADQARAANGLTLYRYRGASRDYLSNPPAHAQVRENLRRIIRICRESGVRLALFLFPTKESTYKAEYQRLFPDSVDYLKNEEEGYRMLAEQARSEGIGCLDLTAGSREEGRTSILYQRDDPHWSIEGNRFAALQVAGFLTSVKADEEETE